MSHVLWSDALVPGRDAPVVDYHSADYGDLIRVPGTKALPVDEVEAGLPDRRVYRSMSRAGVLLSLACLRARTVLAPMLDADRFGVGVYAAVENGPVDFAVAREMAQVGGEAFAERYRKLCNPKKYLRQLPSLAAAQMSIFLGIQGPMHVYNHSTHGSLQALGQAEIDLAEGRVAAALVCSAFSFENALVMERIRRFALGDRILCEAAGAMLLTRDQEESRWDRRAYDDTAEYFGISHQIIVQVLDRRTPDGG